MTFASLLYLLIISIFLGRHFRWYLCRLYLPYISVRNINICKGNIIVIKNESHLVGKHQGIIIGILEMTIKGCIALQKAEIEEVVFHLKENHGRNAWIQKYAG